MIRVSSTHCPYLIHLQAQAQAAAAYHYTQQQQHQLKHAANQSLVAQMQQAHAQPLYTGPQMATGASPQKGECLRG